MQKKRFISFITATVMIITMFAGLAAVTSFADDTETVYNFSDLTAESYASGSNVFEGALTISGTQAATPQEVSASIVSPLGVSHNVSSALMTKQLAVKVHLNAGETVVEYYCFSDTKLSPKSLDMVVKNSSGVTVATEDNNENKGGFKPYVISYKAETDGDYTIVETGTNSTRTVVYAVAVTTAEYDSGDWKIG